MLLSPLVGNSSETWSRSGSPAARLSRCRRSLSPGTRRTRRGSGAEKQTSAGVRVIVFGACDAGIALITRLLGEPDAAYQPVALLDDDPAKRNLTIMGVPVVGNRYDMASGGRFWVSALLIAIRPARPG